MFIAPVDATLGESEWRPFVESHPFGHLVAPGGPDRDVPVVVPTQFVLAGRTVWLHLVRANPVFGALAENPRVVMSVADDWAFIPSSWKAIADEDPTLGIPTTYYGAVQLVGDALVHDERTAPGSVAEILRRQLAFFQRRVPVADPFEAHNLKLLGILGIEIRLEGDGQVQVRRQRRPRPPAGGGGAIGAARQSQRRGRRSTRRAAAGGRSRRGRARTLRRSVSGPGSVGALPDDRL
jgi:transcriptional regulator